MGSCASSAPRRERKALVKTKGKIAYLNNLKEAEACRLKLSKQLSVERVSKIPKIDIQKSELYSRRMNQNTKKSEVQLTS